MKIIGLTGSIGMGKTTTSAMFRDLGVPVWDADGAVHRLYGVGGAGAKALGDRFRDAIRPDHSVDRDVLAKLVLSNPPALKELESIVHPLVGSDRASFLADARRDRHDLVIVDVPLLFETDGENYVDAVIVVTCDPDINRARVLARAGMTPEKLASILARQLPDADKRARADFIITTDISLDDTREQVGRLYQTLIQTHHLSNES